MKKLRDLIFFSHREDHWMDGWTYGDWRQYLCRRPDGSIQCARYFDGFYLLLIAAWFLPFAIFVVGMLLGMTVPSDKLNWSNIYGAGVFSLTPVVIWLTLRHKNIAVMTAVGPRQYEGKRVFSHEV